MSTPVIFVPGLIVVPVFTVALTLPFSILTGLNTFHFPFGNFWNAPHGALPPVCATAGTEATIMEATMSTGVERCFIVDTRIANAAC